MMTQFARPLMATLLAVLLAVGTLSPAYAQDAPAVQSPTGEPRPANSPSPTVSLGSSKYNFTRGPRSFPNLIAPYYPISIPEPGATNTPKLEQMIHDGKLELTLQDAVELALANNMDIVVARYNPWFADTDILKTESGGTGRGTAGASFPFSTANIPFLSFDPLITGTVLFDQIAVPVNNTINPYWELVYARQNVDVQQQAVTVAEKLYSDNKKQLEIGTMAPLDVTRAESELATDNQNLIVARTAQLQQEQNLKNAVSKDPLAANFVNVQILPTD